jgi:hypothetical protein
VRLPTRIPAEFVASYICYSAGLLLEAGRPSGTMSWARSSYICSKGGLHIGGACAGDSSAIGAYKDWQDPKDGMKTGGEQSYTWGHPRPN